MVFEIQQKGLKPDQGEVSLNSDTKSAEQDLNLSSLKTPKHSKEVSQYRGFNPELLNVIEQALTTEQKTSPLKGGIEGAIDIVISALPDSLRTTAKEQLTKLTKEGAALAQLSA
jgi:hypothetical protein